MGPSKGSTLRNRTCAGTAARSRMRKTYSPLSTLTPIQTFGGHWSRGATLASLAERFVRI